MPDFMNIFGDVSKTKDSTTNSENQLINDTAEDNEEVSLSPMYDFVFRVWILPVFRYHHGESARLRPQKRAGP